MTMTMTMAMALTLALTLARCGPPASHDLGVALSEEGLRLVAAPVLLQVADRKSERE